MVGLWREQLGKVNQKAAQSLADPTEYENLFPGLKETFKAEQYLRPQRRNPIAASNFPNIPVSIKIDVHYMASYVKHNIGHACVDSLHLSEKDVKCDFSGVCSVKQAIKFTTMKSYGCTDIKNSMFYKF